MSDAIRRGTIIIDLQQGKAELKAPDLKPVLQAREQEIKLVEKLQAATEKAAQSQSSWSKGVEQLKQEPFERGLRVMQQQKQAAEAAGTAAKEGAENAAHAQEMLAHSTRKAAKGMLDVAEGGFLIARAAVLFGGASGEEFEKMIRNLAAVEAAFALFKGVTRILKGLEEAQKALAAATAAQALATSAETAAEAQNAAATAAMTARDYAAVAAKIALAAVSNPLLLVVVALAAAYVAYTNARDGATAADRRAWKEGEEELKQFNKTQGAVDEWEETQKRIADLRREGMTPAQKSADLQRSADEAVFNAGSHTEASKNFGAQVRLQELQKANSLMADAVSKLNERLKVEQDIADEKVRQNDKIIEQIKNQEKAVDAARNQLRAEQDKVTAFKAQLGMLTDSQFARVQRLNDKVRGGQELSRSEIRYLAQHGEDSVAQALAAQRAERRGVTADFTKGLPGGERMAEDLAKATQNLADQIKELNRLTEGKTAAAKIAELETEKNEAVKHAREAIAKIDAQIKILLAAIDANSKKILDLGISLGFNSGE